MKFIPVKCGFNTNNADLIHEGAIPYDLEQVFSQSTAEMTKLLLDVRISRVLLCMGSSTFDGLGIVWSEVHI